MILNSERLRKMGSEAIRGTINLVRKSWIILNSPGARSVEFAILVLGFFLAALTFYLESEDRQNQRLVNAWQIVLESAPGASGKVPALEFLYSKKQPMFGLDLSHVKHGHPVYLRDLDFCDKPSCYRAYLPHSSFAGAIVDNAKLRKSIFVNSCLYLTNLTGSDLREGDFSDADLSRAILDSTDLKDAEFDGANLSGTSFRSSKNLTQVQLDSAFYCDTDGGKPALPDGEEFDPPPRRHQCKTSEGCLWSGVKRNYTRSTSN